MSNGNYLVATATTLVMVNCEIYYNLRPFGGKATDK